MNNKTFSVKFVTFAVVFLGLCMLVPVWQSSVSAGLSYKINALNTNISALSRQSTEVKAQIANITNPENMVRMASTCDTMVLASNI